MPALPQHSQAYQPTLDGGLASVHGQHDTPGMTVNMAPLLLDTSMLPLSNAGGIARLLGVERSLLLEGVVRDVRVEVGHAAVCFASSVCCDVCVCVCMCRPQTCVCVCLCARVCVRIDVLDLARTKLSSERVLSKITTTCLLTQ